MGSASCGHPKLSVTAHTSRSAAARRLQIGGVRPACADHVRAGSQRRRPRSRPPSLAAPSLPPSLLRVIVKSGDGERYAKLNKPEEDLSS
uniref:Uncharacterized protein n=1 Tax=Leersia perrieri TaxID=77586 RepID=A0A0D9WRF6_9ORYZ